MTENEEICYICNGSGELPYRGHQVCYICKGSGVIEAEGVAEREQERADEIRDEQLEDGEVEIRDDLALDYAVER